MAGEPKKKCDHVKDIHVWPAGTWINETMPNGRVRVVCSVCEKFYGYRGAEPKGKP